jgi:hypothetical protein
MHLVGYLYEDYHDARSLEHKLYSLWRHDRQLIACEEVLSKGPS